jgi:pimeloyl-ACP methyl ester carboxylesterase
MAATAVVIMFFLCNIATANDCEQNILRISHAVPHISSVPAIDGVSVLLSAREVVMRGHSHSKDRKVVLFVHGGTSPSVPDYDLQFKDYSWAEFLAKNGFDVFMMDVSGYGFSPRPKMNDPCNVDPTLLNLQLLIPNPLAAACASPSYGYKLTTRQSEWDEINTVVDYIRALRGVDKVNLVGWSAGGPRIGGFAAHHPEKVDKLFFYAGSGSRTESSTPPAQVPAIGYPMALQSHSRLMEERWNLLAVCDGQIDPDIQPVIWNSIMSSDTIGATWGDPPWNPISTPNGGLMRSPVATNWGWNASTEALIKAPALFVVGDADLSDARRYIYEDIGSASKVWITVACATHFMLWEKQHKVLHETSKEWFLHGSINGVKNGELVADEDGKIRKIKK